MVDRDVKNLLHNPSDLHYTNNLNKEERQALRALRDNDKLIIKPAVNGGAIVIMNKDDYMKEASRLLRDRNTYTPLDRDPLFEVSRKINKLLDDNLDGKIIDKNTHKFLKAEHPITPVFYFLPKIHKNLHNPPGRPIVASTDSIFSPLAQHLGKGLTPLVKTTHFYLLDTGHFLDYSQGKLFPLWGSILLAGMWECNGVQRSPPYANTYMASFEETYVYPNILYQQHAII